MLNSGSHLRFFSLGKQNVLFWDICRTAMAFWPQINKPTQKGNNKYRMIFAICY